MWLVWLGIAVAAEDGLQAAREQMGFWVRDPSEVERLAHRLETIGTETERRLA